jgi:hypothetical protein
MSNPNVRTEWSQDLVDRLGLEIAKIDYRLRGFMEPWYGVSSECPSGKSPLSLQDKCKYGAMAVAALEAMQP